MHILEGLFAEAVTMESACVGNSWQKYRSSKDHWLHGLCVYWPSRAGVPITGRAASAALPHGCTLVDRGCLEADRTIQTCRPDRIPNYVYLEDCSSGTHREGTV